jgi:hypothetical protein
MTLYIASTSGETPDITIMPTTKEHVRELIETIREDDKREIESYGFSCAKGLWRSYKQGFNNKTALIDGKVCAIWGVGGTLMGYTGQPWLLTSSEVYKISPVKFARIYKREVNNMLKIFPSLVNYVADDYPQAIRLLSLCGFKIGERQMLGKGWYRKFSQEAA